MELGLEQKVVLFSRNCEMLILYICTISIQFMVLYSQYNAFSPRSLHVLSTFSPRFLYVLSTFSLRSLYVLSTFFLRSLRSLYVLSTFSPRSLYVLSTFSPLYRLLIWFLLFTVFSFLAPKDFYIILLSNILALNVLDEVYVFIW